MPDRYGDRDDDHAYHRVASTVGDYDPTAEELATFVADAKASLAIGCRYCHAKPHEPCFNDITDEVVRKFIVHTIRVIDAATRTPTDDDKELF